MALSAEDQGRLLKATERALAWHADQDRKGTSIPYYSHLTQVQGLVFEHGGDVDHAIAALLHDSLEDADSSDERAERERGIEDAFGRAVLDIVLDCTDTDPGDSVGDKAPWRQRKTRYTDHLAGVGRASLLVAACDKRHNLHCLVWDIRDQGLTYLDRFNAGVEEQIWYFRSLLDVFEPRIPRRLAMELRALVEEFEALVRE
jgi:(p)ppGpp synthase/HD superfamily hydrolase